MTASGIESLVFFLNIHAAIFRCICDIVTVYITRKKTHTNIFKYSPCFPDFLLINVQKFRQGCVVATVWAARGGAKVTGTKILNPYTSHDELGHRIAEMIQLKQRRSVDSRACISRNVDLILILENGRIGFVEWEGGE